MAASVEPPAFRYTDGFKTSGTRKKRTGKPVLQHTSSELYDSSLQDLRTGSWLQECHRSFSASAPDPSIKNSCFLAGLTRDAVKEASIDSPSVLCLGLGCPASSRNARSQLAFLIETRDNLFLVCTICYVIELQRTGYHLTLVVNRIAIKLPHTTLRSPPRT